MGCSENKHHDNDLFEAINTAEKNFGLYKKSPQEIETCFKKWAYQGKITKTQLLKVQEQLNVITLPPSELEKSKINSWMSDEGLTRFYSNFLHEEDNSKLDQQKLIIAALILSGGTQKEKASIIFDNLETDASGKIGVKELNIFITLLIKLSQEYLLEYASGWPYPKDPLKVISKEQIEDLKRQ